MTGDSAGHRELLMPSPDTEAIRLHGGEGTAARDGYLALPQKGRDRILSFLEAL